jgi:hypothetical protein
LDVDHRLRAAQLECEAFVVAQQLGVLGRQRIGRSPLGAALDGLQGLIGAGVTLTAPIGQRRRIQPLPPKDGARATWASVVDLAQDSNLVGRRERSPPAGPVHKFGRRCR